MINIIWAGMFLIAAGAALIQALFSQDTAIFGRLIASIFDNAQAAVQISIGLIGILSFWLGILKLVEESGLTEKISAGMTPLFRIIMKDIPADSPAVSTVVLNMAANFLGLDNAATPVGLKAMEQLQEHNPRKDTASDAQILFMILNASSVTLIPMTVFMYRSQAGADTPTDVFIPILLATSVSTLTGFIAVAVKQKIPLTDKTLLKWLGSCALLILFTSGGFYFLDESLRLAVSAAMGNFLLLLLICGIIFTALSKKVMCYEAFTQGAKEGFYTAVRILPYILGMLIAIGMFRAAGILDFCTDAIKKFCQYFGYNGSFADALPTAFMKPLSGSGARAMMIETMNTFGADSFAAFCSSVIQGSTETTFYVLTVYFGAVNISKTRYALKYALWADAAGIIAAIFFSYMFYAG